MHGLKQTRWSEFYKYIYIYIFILYHKYNHTPVLFTNLLSIWLKGRPHGRTRGYFTSYFCTCTTFSVSYTYKSTCVCTSTTSSNHVGYFVRRTRVRRTNVRAWCIQMGLLSSLAIQIKWCFYKIYTINCYTNTNYILTY